ncbi:uncharacterized protein LOC142554069 [Primulina tabacum]|uniref:uncharacterized protein LOC142554069 n=1 Tax=Primulina tabacum TaxID=48773 RepID=UPI003F59311B
MGFDIECIINIQTYPGEYFCPVCRTLIYPNEAFQSQCSHLYCKPCLSHIANGSKACPYDGYLVTETDSKPLIDSDRTLAEKIGNVKVHCLFFRSGCTWEGTLSDCISHCSECSFGNSAVICNRCGIQIVHRQVHDHAQCCTGVYEAKQATEGVPGVTSSGTALSTTTATVNITTTQSGQPHSQPHNSQNVAVNLQPGQNPNQQPIANLQAVSVLTTEHSYQQQYQQYYQQYAGYDPYQQPHQQYQHNPLHAHVQPQSHAYTQPPAPAQPQPPTQPQPHAQPQLHAQPLPLSHSHHQPQLQPYPVPQTQQQPQFQPPGQGQAQSQPPVLSQIPMQVQVPSQVQPQLRAPNQTFPPNYHVNPQQQPPYLMYPQAQIPPQIPPLPPHSQPNQLPLGVQAVSMQPAVQHPQSLSYFQPPLQTHHSHASQNHSQPQFQNQTSNQSHLQIQPASQYQNQYPQLRPPPLNQPTVSAAQPQLPHPPASSVIGHHPYQQPQTAHQMHSGVFDQTPINLRPTSGSLHPVKLHGQVPHQPAVMRPPPSHDSFPPQPPSAFLLPQSQISGAPPAHQQISAHSQPSNHLLQHGTVFQPVQQAVPQQIAQQQPFVTPVKAQFQQQSRIQQQPLQPQPRPYGPPQQSQNHDVKLMMSNEGLHPQNYPQPSSGFGAVVHTVPAQLGSTQPPANMNSVESAVLEKEDSFSGKHANPDVRVPGQGLAEKEGLGTDVRPLKEEAVMNNKLGPHEMFAIRVKEEVSEIATDKLSGAISIEANTTEGNASKEESHFMADSNLPQKVEEGLESRKEAVVVGLSTDIEKVSKYPLSKPEAQVKEQPLLTLRSPQGLGILQQPGQSLPLPIPTSHTGKAPGYFGPPPGSFEAYPRGNHVGPNEGVMSKHQSSSHLSGSVESAPHRQTHGHEPSIWRANGETDSNFGLRENLNPFPMEPFRPLEQGSITVDKSRPESSYGTGVRLNSGLNPNSRLLPPYRASVGQGHADVFGPGSGQHHAKHFPSRSPDGEYLGISPHEFVGPSRFPRGTAAFDDVNAREAHRFVEGSRSFNLPSDPVGNPFHDSRFHSMPGGQPGRGDTDGQHNLRFGEHMNRPLHNHIKSDDAFGKDGPVPLGRVDFTGPGYLPGNFLSEAAGPGIFSGNSHTGELGGPGNFNNRIPFGGSIRGDRPSIPPFGEPGIRGNYPLQGFPNPGGFAGEVDSFDQSRKRRPISMGWCRICVFDCQTVEGLEMHSQTREHQKMAMDMVKTIKQRNKKKQRSFAGHMGYDGGNRSKKVGANGRGNKP